MQEQVTALVDADFPYLVVIHEGVVAALVDALGGLTVTIPTRMVYRDQTQGLLIDLQPGRQQLNGQQVEHFVRWRDSSGDIGRLERRQQVINALDAAVQNPGVWARLPMLKKTLEDEAKAGRLVTNLDLQALPALARGLANRDTTLEILPGREGYYRGLSYWFAEQGALPPQEPAATPLEPDVLPQRGVIPPGLTPLPPPQEGLPLDIAVPPAIPPLIQPTEQSDTQTGEP